MNIKQGGLPAGYTQLKYIEANGNHFINTDIYITDMTDILRATFAMTNMATNNDYVIFGGQTGRWALSIDSNSRQSPYVKKPLYVEIGASAFNTGIMLDSNVFCTVEVNPNNDTFTFDGTQNPVTNRWDRYAVAPVLYQLFNRNSLTTASAHVKLQYAEVVNKGYFVPCMRNSDSEIGVFNTVTGVFLQNAGSGKFGYETMSGNYVAPIT